jgi:hypothetical protein
MEPHIEKLLTQDLSSLSREELEHLVGALRDYNQLVDAKLHILHLLSDGSSPNPEAMLVCVHELSAGPWYALLKTQPKRP